MLEADWDSDEELPPFQVVVTTSFFLDLDRKGNRAKLLLDPALFEFIRSANCDIRYEFPRNERTLLDVMDGDFDRGWWRVE